MIILRTEKDRITRHIRCLAQRSQGHAFEQCLGPFVFDDDVGRVSSIAVFWRIASFAFLTLQAYLEDFHRRDYSDCFCDASCETSCGMRS